MSETNGTKAEEESITELDTKSVRWILAELKVKGLKAKKMNHRGARKIPSPKIYTSYCDELSL